MHSPSTFASLFGSASHWLTVSSFVALAAFGAPAALAGCGSSGDGSSGSPSDGGIHDGSVSADSSAPTPDAAPVDSSTRDAATPYPALAIPLPQVRNVGGLVLGTPRIVPILYASDDPTFKTEILAFLDGLPATDYWKTTASEYGVTGATVTAPVIITDPAPTTIDDSAIQPWIADYLNAVGSDAGAADSGTSAWPAADGNSIYIVFYPSGTTVTTANGSGGVEQSCVDFGAYHDEDPLDTGSTPYAVVARCTNYLGHGGIEFVTSAASHELMEASTDPFPTSAPAYDDTDFNGSGWDLNAGGPEIGDLCKLEATSLLEPAGLGYVVQRMWSDQAALGGHEPCIPHLAGAGAYFTAFPDLEGVEAYPGYYVSGVTVEPGTSRTIPIYLVSDAPTPGPWTVSATEQGSPQAPADPDHLLSFAWDHTTGENGDVVHLTITRAATPTTTSTHGLPLVISSTLTTSDGGTETNSFWTIVGE